ncbi:MAG: hypothetical protein A4E47_00778 [Methanosaeta sp. PtaU1.Bin028]|nr:MAG: hypothetical protein A4E47_00778 [Methanosaeta sp. PtaU1.Bin028]
MPYGFQPTDSYIPFGVHLIFDGENTIRSL